MTMQTPPKYLKLEGRQHGDYSYPDLLVPLEKTKIHVDWDSPARLSDKPFRTYNDQEKTWDKTLQKLAHNGEYVLTIRQFIDFVTLLKSNVAYDEDGKKVDPNILEEHLERILTPGNGRETNPDKNRWSEILQNTFLVTKPSLPSSPPGYETRSYLGRSIIIPNDLDDVSSRSLMTYHQIMSDGTLQQKVVELNIAGDYFYDEEDREFVPRPKKVDLDSWLRTADKYGLPTPNTSAGKMNYVFPSLGGISAFVANISMTFVRPELSLNCNGGFWNVNLEGTRLARLDKT
jgi:hypothetical protein